MCYFNNLTNYSCLYEYTPNSIRTIVKQLKQEITLNGKLPKYKENIYEKRPRC